MRFDPGFDQPFSLFENPRFDIADTRPPIVLARPLAFRENAVAGEAVGEVVALDGVFGSGVADLSLGGPGSAWFSVDDGGTVRLTEAGADSPLNDFETGPNEATLQVTATDAAGNTSRARTLIIETRNEPGDERPDTRPGDGGDGEATLDLSFVGDALAGARDRIADAFDAAWKAWTETFDLATDSQIDIAVDTTETAEADTIATARANLLDTGKTTADGQDLVRSEVVQELRDGRERRPDEPDAYVTFARDLSQFAFGDGTEANRFDAETILKHELGHVLGFTATGPFDGAQTAFEAGTETSFFAGLTFEGETAGEVALANDAHLTEGLMAPSIGPGQEKAIGRTDLEVLADLGVPVADDALDTSQSDPLIA
ncbi:hypothetical protein SAMN05216241_1246 [Limimonas halophila]|uniref:Cadherin domain-containing protein n=1 Tax=Limimonas halophila TaxID=1082479 RepID=A0A1G7VBB6_9PROT|nr:cadherin repeat domain-containing protein [Limimonas halophila]SDG56250.1 hypothetical protein SAMN05216241_1246 [Limimonas halophila]